MSRQVAEFDAAAAKIAIHRRVWDTLNEMAIDDELSDAEVQDVEESMENLADLLIESLRLEVVSVNDNEFSVKLQLD